jgi:hypothetical protein
MEFEKHDNAHSVIKRHTLAQVCMYSVSTSLHVGAHGGATGKILPTCSVVRMSDGEGSQNLIVADDACG